MKLIVSKRTHNKKSEAKVLRREGDIPAVIYSKGKVGETIFIKGREFQKHLTNVKRGYLPTTVFTLVDEEGKERKAIIKDIQYHVTTYNILHLDFVELHDDVMVNIKVPIEYLGAAECVGVKLGGVLRQVIRHLKVRCLPKDMPSSFFVEVQNLNMTETKRLRDIDIPEGVRPMVNLDEVAVIIAKR
jgi:large subunit ribosomal protein L25